MSASATDSGMRVYYDFGRLSKPVFSLERYQEALKQYEAFMDPAQGLATVTTVFGDTITMRRGPTSTEQHDRGAYTVTYEHTKLGQAQLRIRPDDVFYIDTNNIFILASLIPLNPEDFTFTPSGCKREDMLKVANMDTECAFPIRHTACIPSWKNYEQGPDDAQIEKWSKLWEHSQLRLDLIKALQTHAKDIRRVDRVVCFGLGSMDNLGSRGYIQHLAACTIAKTLSKAQAAVDEKPKTIEIFAQDLDYKDQAVTALMKFDPPITVLNYKVNEILQKVNRHTFLISIGATAEIVEAALAIVGEDGLAGTLYNKMVFNGEADLDRKEFPTAKGRSPSVLGAASENKWQYKTACICEPITDNELFGGSPWSDYESFKSPLLDGLGNIRIDSQGRAMMNEVENVKRKDENGRDIVYDYDTELLLRRN